MTSPILSLRHIGRTFKSGDGEPVEILKGLDLDIEPGTFNVIRGESGSGKTTLLRILGMLDSDFEGEYRFGEHRVKGQSDWFLDELRAANIGFIFQEGRLFTHLTLRRNIEVPLLLQGDRDARRQAGRIVDDLAPRFFEDRDKRKEILRLLPGPASGGQKQRASIMRAIINRPCIILADEPTASLHGDLKLKVVEYLKALCGEGHTVIVVSHDSVFYGTGRQLDLVDGSLREVAAAAPPETAPALPPPPAAGGTVAVPPGTAALSVRPPAHDILWGWKPRAPLRVLLRQALRETVSRPIFLFLILISLSVGVCQVSVFASVIVGAQQFLDDAMTKGSRLNRVQIKPRRTDLNAGNRFPDRERLAASGQVERVVPRRITLAALKTTDGESHSYNAIGLVPGDPEYGLLDFVAGGPFSGDHDQLEVIVAAGLLQELFDTQALADGSVDYRSFIGRKVPTVLRQYTSTGDVKGETTVQLTVRGIILYGEGGRQLYLPSVTHAAFDRFKMDRVGEFPLPITAAGDAWTDPAAVKAMADYPWEDSLHIYTRGMRDVIPVIKELSRIGYKPQSDIWRYKWALDVQDTAWSIFLPLLGLIVVSVSITVAANIFTSAKLRETELALWRVLGMRRGDLVLTQVVSTILSVSAGSVFGLWCGAVLVDQSKALLAQRSAEAAVESGVEPQRFDAIFAPVDEFSIWILLTALALGVLAALYPAFRAANTDPAKVLQA